ncbi:hypothetical protein VII_000163 [Vibrio mimicus MB451]|nr:hypothetical protein VII_000163 [Vibrio mimicus MB451]
MNVGICLSRLSPRLAGLFYFGWLKALRFSIELDPVVTQMKHGTGITGQDFPTTMNGHEQVISLFFGTVTDLDP